MLPLATFASAVNFLLPKTRQLVHVQLVVLVLVLARLIPVDYYCSKGKPWGNNDLITIIIEVHLKCNMIELDGV